MTTILLIIISCISFFSFKKLEKKHRIIEDELLQLYYIVFGIYNSKNYDEDFLLFYNTILRWYYEKIKKIEKIHNNVVWKKEIKELKLGLKKNIDSLREKDIIESKDNIIKLLKTINDIIILNLHYHYSK